MATKGANRRKPAGRDRMRPSGWVPRPSPQGVRPGAAVSPGGLVALAGLWAGDTDLDADLATLYASRALSAR